MQSVQLSDEALTPFNDDFTAGPIWPALRDALAAYDGTSVRALDIGGGAGVFADKLLEAFACWQVVLLDNSPFLLSSNTVHPRKTLLQANAEQIAAEPGPVAGQFDVIFLNLVLHHLVTRWHGQSRKLQGRVIAAAASRLKPQGRIVVIEQVCVPHVPRFPAGRLVYEASSSRLLARVAKRMGANTAGVGVLFFNTGELEQIFGDHGFALERKLPFADTLPGYLRKLNLFHIERTILVFRPRA